MNPMLNWKIRSTHKTQPSDSDFQRTVESYQKTLNSEEIGFFRLPQNKKLIEETTAVYEQFKNKKYFIHIGIGGSALGPDMLLKALGGKSDTQFIFLNN